MPLTEKTRFNAPSSRASVFVDRNISTRFGVSKLFQPTWMMPLEPTSQTPSASIWLQPSSREVPSNPDAADTNCHSPSLTGVGMMSDFGSTGSGFGSGAAACATGSGAGAIVAPSSHLMVSSLTLMDRSRTSPGTSAVSLATNSITNVPPGRIAPGGMPMSNSMKFLLNL